MLLTDFGDQEINFVTNIAVALTVTIPAGKSAWKLKNIACKVSYFRAPAPGGMVAVKFK